MVSRSYLCKALGVLNYQHYAISLYLFFPSIFRLSCVNFLSPFFKGGDYILKEQSDVESRFYLAYFNPEKRFFAPQGRSELHNG